MRTRWMIGALVSAFAFTGAAAEQKQPETGDVTGAQPPSTQPSPHTSTREPIELRGVVSKHEGNELTLVAPLGAQTTITEVGDATVVDRELKLVSLKGKIDEGTTVMRDGRPVKATELREGDFVRTSFEPGDKSFSRIDATSPEQLERQRSGMQQQSPESPSEQRLDNVPQQPGTMPEQ